jgi:AcrR family transcriptional regulator
VTEPALESRERVLAGTYECIARVGIAKTTVEDAARAAGVSRATVYRLFPGGREELLRDTVAWEMARFFARLGVALGPTADFCTFLERALPLAREEVLAHEVLQKVLETEPDRLMPLITVEQHHVIGYLAAYFLRCSNRTATPVSCGRASTSAARPSTSPGWRCR